MFPLEYPSRVLRKHATHDPTVLDPFCGRGTTLFSARQLRLRVWGIDSSPVAVAIAKAMLASCDLEEPLALAKYFIESGPPKVMPQTRFFRAAYTPKTLRNICSIREGLLQLKTETDASVILRAAMLGCLHGPLSKHIASAGYFSNQMPRTYSSKPAYAVRYWKKRKLKAPKVNIIEVLRRKLTRIANLPNESSSPTTQVLLGDSQKEATYSSLPRNPSVIVTSPPYYGMRAYVQDQWLRNWFLGGPSHVDYSAGPQLEHGSQATFAKSLGQVWANVGKSSAQVVHMYVRFGTGREVPGL